MNSSFAPFPRKDAISGLSEAAIAAFERAFKLLAAKESGLISESSINPVEQLPNYEEISSRAGRRRTSCKGRHAEAQRGPRHEHGTWRRQNRSWSCAMARPFLDLIARQVLATRKQTGANLRFLLMNSFSTSEDTRHILPAIRSLATLPTSSFFRTKCRRSLWTQLLPVEWPADPELEWCPPGHGDLYPAILGSGVLDRLLKEGYLYLFVSNSDNLGATMDPALLSWFAGSDMPFLMEVTDAHRGGSQRGPPRQAGQ